MSTAIEITLSGSWAGLDEFLAKAENRQELNAFIGEGVATVVKDHFIELDGASIHGGSSSHFYERAAQGVTHVEDSEGTTIQMSGPIGLRLQYAGGTVHPTQKKLLAIPAMIDTYNKHPSEFEELTFMWGKDKQGTVRPVALIEKEANQGRIRVSAKRTRVLPQTSLQPRRGDHLTTRERFEKYGLQNHNEQPRIFFWLATEATIGPHPNIIPDIDAIAAAARMAADEYLKATKQR